MTHFELFKAILIDIILKTIVLGKKHAKKLTNLSLNKGAVSILVTAIKNRQLFPALKGLILLFIQQFVFTRLICNFRAP